MCEAAAPKIGPNLLKVQGLITSQHRETMPRRGNSQIPIFRGPLTFLPVDDDQKHPQRSDQKDEGGELVPSRTHPSSLGDVVLQLAPSLFTVGQPQHRWQTDHII